MLYKTLFVFSYVVILHQGYSNKNCNVHVKCRKDEKGYTEIIFVRKPTGKQ
jgi:hypothetical protein